MIAIRYDAKEVAAFGLVAALIAPPVVGASPTTLTLLFVAVTLVGTTAIALFRTWPYLPPLAFVLAAPQLGSWLAGDPVPVQAIVALAGFWLVNIVAAAGEEVRIRRNDLRPSSATLVLANATFLLWGGYVVLDGDSAAWLGTFIAVASLAHLLIGAWFLVRQGLEHLFGNLVAGTGVALLAIAAFVQLGAAVVPLAWAAEAVALAWLAVRRRHKWSAAASLALAGLVVTHLALRRVPVLGVRPPRDSRLLAAVPASRGRLPWGRPGGDRRGASPSSRSGGSGPPSRRPGCARGLCRDLRAGGHVPRGRADRARAGGPPARPAHRAPAGERRA